MAAPVKVRGFRFRQSFRRVVMGVGGQLLQQVVAVKLCLVGVASGHPGVAGGQGRKEHGDSQEEGRKGCCYAWGLH